MGRPARQDPSPRRHVSVRTVVVLGVLPLTVGPGRQLLNHSAARQHALQPTAQLAAGITCLLYTSPSPRD
eukprot:15387394-Alexandrium_andersonii.AAC.1